MKPYLNSIFHQLEVANTSILNIINHLEESEVDEELIKNKRTIREVLAHLAVIYKADFLIMNGASKVGMEEFYKASSPNSLIEIKESLNENYQFLQNNMYRFTESELLTPTTSWWGVTYTRVEWLIEMLGHVYHHRGQLHTMLILQGKNIQVPLFE